MTQLVLRELCEAVLDRTEWRRWLRGSLDNMSLLRTYQNYSYLVWVARQIATYEFFQSFTDGPKVLVWSDSRSDGLRTLCVLAIKGVSVERNNNNTPGQLYIY